MRDASRLAGSNPQMMIDILLSNEDAILDKVRSVRATLDQLIAEIEASDTKALKSRLQSAKQAHDEYIQQRWK